MSTIGEYFKATVIRGIDEGIGIPGVVQSMHGTPRDQSLELMTASTGPTGPAGEPAKPFRWEGDIADRAALTSLSRKLGLAQAGKAWRILSTNTLVYWNGTGFDTFTDAFGAAGPDGQPCTVTIGTVETGAIGSELTATIVGTPPNLTLNLRVPRGVKGRKGERGGPGPIRSAPDYTDGTHVDRMVPVWDGPTQKWRPTPYPGLRGPWSLVEGRAWDGGAGFAADRRSVTSATLPVAQLTIPAQDTAWRPVISGGVAVQTTEEPTKFTTRVDAEVRLGSTTGQIVAMAAGFAYGVDYYAPFAPFYGASLTPDSTLGIVPAGQAAVLHVVLNRVKGSVSYHYSQARAQIVCWARPVGTGQNPVPPPVVFTTGRE